MMDSSDFILGLLPLWLIAAGCACSRNQDDGVGDVVREVSGYTASRAVGVVTPPVSTGQPLEGMGVEFDPHFLSQNVPRNDASTASDWERTIVYRVKKMGIQRFRVMLLPHWWEPVNDNSDSGSANLSAFTFDSPEMRSLYAELDLAEEIRAHVTLVLWGCPQAHFLSNGAPGWVTAPSDYREFAENFSVVLKHLIETKGYTCIREITPFNEPDGNIIELSEYVKLVRILDARLRADGIRSKVKLNLSDNTDTRRFFLEGCADALADIADIYNSHTYIFGYDTPNSTVLGWEAANIQAIKATGKKHFVGEFGSDQTVGASRQTDIDEYKRGVLMARHCLNFINAGAAGASYWILMDMYYNKNASYGELQQLGLWIYTVGSYPASEGRPYRMDYQPRPQYYAYSLLTRFIRRGDTAYMLDLGDEFAAGTAFLDKDGKWTYIFANGSRQGISLDFSNPNPGGSGKCRIYSYEERKLPKGDAMIESSVSIRPDGDVFRLHIPSQSILLLSQK